MKHPVPWYVIEGADGAGHTSSASGLCQLLEERGYKVIHTCEPSQDSEYGRGIRDILAGRSPKVDPSIFQLMYVLDREHHIRVTNERALRDGADMVISERYLYSTIAYGVASLAGSYEQMYILNCLFDRPKRAFFLDAHLEEMRRRMEVSRDRKDMFEADSNLQWKVVSVYNKISDDRRFPEVEWVDAGGSLNATVNILLQRILETIN